MMFLFSSEKNIIRYRRIGYNLNVMLQSAFIGPVVVDGCALLLFFGCTPVGRASDSMVAPAWSYSFGWLGPGLLDCCLAHRGSAGIFLLLRVFGKLFGAR